MLTNLTEGELSYEKSHPSNQYNVVVLYGNKQLLNEVEQDMRKY